MALFKTAAVAAIFVLGSFAAQAQTILNLGHVLAKDSHYSRAVQAFGSRLGEISGGKFTVREHAAGALGGERDMIEGLSIGTVDLLISGTPILANFTDQVVVLDLPFLFENYEHARATFDGPVGEKIFSALEAENFVPLAWIENGFRQVSNSKHAVRTPDDMKGLKIRTQENALHIEAFNDLGAAATPLAFPELFAALQQGVIDGQENPLTIFVTSNFFEVQKHLSLTSHLYGTGVLQISPTLWEKLNEEERGWMRDAAGVAVKAGREAVDEIEANALKLVREKGVELTTDPDKAAFRAAVEGVYETFRGRYDASILDMIPPAKSAN